MKLAFFVCIFFTGLFTPAVAIELTVERIHQSPDLTGSLPVSPLISPDGSTIAFLRGRTNAMNQLDLWAQDVETGNQWRLAESMALLETPEVLSQEEKNRRERQRISDDGIIAFQWSNTGKEILFSLNGDIFILDISANTTERITNTKNFETDPKLSSSGRYVTYVRDDNIYIFDRRDSREKRLTHSSRKTIRNGVAEFVVQEELERNTGYWVSPDEKHVIYTEIDESSVDIVERLDFEESGSKIVKQRYPFAGAANVRWRVGVKKIGVRRTKWIDFGNTGQSYLARVYWSKDGNTTYTVILSRDQKRLDVFAINAASGHARLLLTETSESWIGSRYLFKPLPGGDFIWGSERDGFNHLYLYKGDGTLLGAITQGDWPVLKINCYNPETNVLYFSGWQETPLERHVYSVNLNSSEPVQVTKKAGWNEANFAKNCSRYINVYSNPNQPPQVSLHDEAGRHLAWLYENKIQSGHPYAPYVASHLDWKFGTIKAEDGAEMHYRYLKPADASKHNKRPAIVIVYGGPLRQRVRHAWETDMLQQVLADKGFVVFQLDNRGSDNRGVAFEAPLNGRLGEIETRDQLRGVEFLKSLPFVDETRIGLSGWSYGGYMTLMLMGQASTTFKAGVAGAPVTEWRLYDTVYTERYLGTPQENESGYDASSVFPYVENITGDLLLIHGMADDNVQLENSVRLMAQLQKKGISFELMTYPGEKHRLKTEHNRIDAAKRILEFFDRSLL